MVSKKIQATLFLIISVCLLLVWQAFSKTKMHNFEGKCQMCHIETPDTGNNTYKITFISAINSLCSDCHTVDKQKSHPLKIRPNKDTHLNSHLDENGLITCTTCHDVHKEDKITGAQTQGLLWGHATGKAFCLSCHTSDEFGANWKHQTSIPFAHSYGKFIESENAAGGMLDKFSAECLSCHDGTISKSPKVEVSSGKWQHGIGLSHPVGIDYPVSDEFTPKESLPQGIKLFDGKVGCLSCHEIYNKEKDMLSVENKNSRLCLACHKK